MSTCSHRQLKMEMLYAVKGPKKLSWIVFQVNQHSAEYHVSQ